MNSLILTGKNIIFIIYLFTFEKCDDQNRVKYIFITMYLIMISTIVQDELKKKII